MERFLRRLGVPDRCYELIKIVISTCEECNAWAPVPSRPKFRAELAGWFGDVLICDLFYIFNQQFLIMVDEAIRYKIAALLPKKDAASIAKCMLYTRFRYFGPRERLEFDQECGKI